MKISSTVQPNEKLPFNDWVNFIRQQVKKGIGFEADSRNSNISMNRNEYHSLMSARYQRGIM